MKFSQVAAIYANVVTALRIEAGCPNSNCGCQHGNVHQTPETSFVPESNVHYHYHYGSQMGQESEDGTINEDESNPVTPEEVEDSCTVKSAVVVFQPNDPSDET